MKPIKELLIIRMSALGDVAMTIPVIYLLAEQNPSISIRVLTRERFKGLFFSCPANISIISCDFGLSNGILGIWKLFKCIKKYHIDAIADLHGILRSYILDFLFAITGTKVTIVHKSRSKRKTLTRLKNKRKVQQKSFFDRYVEVFKRLGLDVQLSQKSSHLPVITKEDREEAVKKIGIAPFARYFTKVYPAELMKTIINNLSQKGYAVYLFGNGAHEYNIMQSLIAESSNASIVPDKLSFQEQLEFMATLDVMVSMDSANMHLASLVNTPVASIWGGTTPLCGFLGWQQSRENAICMDLPCQPCSISGTAECPLHHFSCMNSISPDRVIQNIENIITLNKNKRS